MADWGGFFDGSTPIKAPLDLPGLMAIPGKRGVFLLEGPNRAPLLLATAADIRSRMRFKLSAPQEGPSRKIDLREVAIALHWKLAHSHFETDWRFLELARAIYPQGYQDLLAWSAAWFVHIDPADKAPAFKTTNHPGQAAGEHFGPFPSKSSAQDYINSLLEVFDLCRHENILRQAPNGRPCVYAQMGRCRCPCNGSISMDQYRRLLLEAVAVAGGELEQFRRQAQARMKELAAAQQYEQASAAKAMLARLAELDKPEYIHVGPLGRFRYLLVQEGPGARRLRTFLFDRGWIEPGPEAEFKKPKGKPAILSDESLLAAISAMAEFCRQEHPTGQAQREGIALLAHDLYGNPQRAGLILPWRVDLAPAQLRQAIEKVFSADEPPGGGNSSARGPAG
jgi:hypothetical protein